MYEKQFLVLIKGEDKTKDIKEIHYKDGKYHVTFNSGKTYTYGYQNVQKLYNPIVVNTKNIEVTISGEHVYDVHQILFFKPYAKIIFKNNTSRITNQSNVSTNTISEQNKSNDIFKYLKELAHILKIEVDDDTSFLGKQYDQMLDINKQSVLHIYARHKVTNTTNSTDNIILPFGFNISQEKATRNAIYNTLSVIEGPPGTGKTQTILNIIANAIIKGKTIAVASNNNSATVNIQEKLEEYGLSFISAFLGSKDNKETFLENQENRYPQMDSWKIPDNKLNNLYYTLKNNLKELLKLNELMNDKAEKYNQKQMIEQEYTHFKMASSYSPLITDKTLIDRNPLDILNLIDEITNFKKITTLYKLLFWFKFKIHFNKIYFKTKEDTIERLNHIYYLSSISNYESQINQIDAILQNNNFDSKRNEYQLMSMNYFKGVLYKKYQSSHTRKTFDKNDIYLRFDEVVREYPLILSTTHSLRSMTKTEYIYDYVVIDEASQVDIVSGALALSVARNAVIVGDSMQLPHVVNTTTKKTTEQVFNHYNINECYRYTKSLLDSTKELFRNNIPSTLLREHYRCNPKIIGYCNTKFYNSGLVIHKKDDNSNSLSVFIAPEGNHARGNYNQRQIDIILQEVLPTLEDGYSIGIITPFRDQANMLIDEFKNSDIDADTVHKYQGRDRDVIIISTVSNMIEENSFVDNKNLINVAVSRAKKKLILVTSSDMLHDKRTNISDLVSYIKYNNFEVQESNILSVFDALYKKHSDKILSKYKNPRKVSEFKSENIIYELLTDILKQEKYSNLSILLHYPLKKIIRDYSLLSTDEIKYASNYLTHVDFLIYNKLSKQPVLVVEVDGYAFHNQNDTQLRRDRMKDGILSRYNIKIIRLNTTGSNEKDRILDLL